MQKRMVAKMKEDTASAKGPSSPTQPETPRRLRSRKWRLVRTRTKIEFPVCSQYGRANLPDEQLGSERDVDENFPELPNQNLLSPPT